MAVSEDFALHEEVIGAELGQESSTGASAEAPELGPEGQARRLYWSMPSLRRNEPKPTY